MVEIKLWLYFALLALGINILSRTHLIRMKQVEPTLSQYEMLQYWKRWPFFISPLYTSSFLSRWFFCHMHFAAFLSIHVSCWKRSDPLNICIGCLFSSLAIRYVCTAFRISQTLSFYGECIRYTNTSHILSYLFA